MKSPPSLIRAFGQTEDGEIATPAKISNVQLSRIVNTKKACSHCFPHGIEAHNATGKKNRRSWKNHRKTQYKTRSA